MNRYFYSFMLMTMLINIMFSVPSILIKQRYQGSVMAILASTIIGTIFSFTFTNSILQFPKLGLPEIFKQRLWKWATPPLLLYLGLMWIIAGGLVVIAFSIVIKRFISPEIPYYVNAMLMLSIATWGATRSSKTIMNFTLLTIVTCSPFVLFILYKALSSPNFYWDEVYCLFDYAEKLPTWSSLSAATYVFIGYIELAIFNREIPTNSKLKYAWFIPFLGFFVLISTFIIPIGLTGINGAAVYVFPWVTTSDTLRMEYGFIERLYFVFLILYLILSLLFIVVKWHIGFELVKSSLPNTKWVHWTILLIFIVATLYAQYFLNERVVFSAFQRWLNIRLASEIGLVGLLYVLAKRSKKTI